jgi:hypothetical protein
MPIVLSSQLPPLALDPLESKARSAYERDRQRSHKGHPRKPSSQPHPKQLGWRRSPSHTPKSTTFVVWEDFEDVEYDEPASYDFGSGKENSRPTPLPATLSLQDFVRPSHKKPRQSVSRSSISRQASSDSLMPFNLGLRLTLDPSPSPSPPTSLSSISESPLMPPTLSPSSTPTPSPTSPPLLTPLDADDSDVDSDDDFAELSLLNDAAPGMDEWTIETRSDGCGAIYVASKSMADVKTTTATVSVSEAEW